MPLTWIILANTPFECQCRAYFRITLFPHSRDLGIQDSSLPPLLDRKGLDVTAVKIFNRRSLIRRLSLALHISSKLLKAQLWLQKCQGIDLLC